MDRDELDIIRAIVEDAYRNTDDYVNWNFVRSCEETLKKEDAKNDQHGGQVQGCCQANS